tara:strand:+ start:2687 stop:2875 length:189 start_codon:yes stop_codon:yes gene_type:complete
MSINRGRKRREELRAQAVELAEQRATRSPKQQLTLLDQRLGKDVGAKKERAKLKAFLQGGEK